MKEIQYRIFSLRTHKKNLRIKRSNVCQFELTFRCPLYCRHCYTGCYNQPAYFKEELKTQEVKTILDKVYQAGVIWLCLTGGDPLARADFLEIYSYAKQKGFIVSVFTSGYLLDKKIVKFLKSKPPFVIELTLNAVTEQLYEKISGVKGSFLRLMKGINLLIKERIPLKIKTQVTKDNLEELTKIKKLVEGLGLEFRPSHILYPRLNGDKTPCNLRISPKEILGLDADDRRLSACDDWRLQDSNPHPPTVNLFTCAIGGGDGFHIDPLGNIFLCNLMRKTDFNLLKTDLGYALDGLISQVREKSFLTDSACRDCSLKRLCNWCPGRAYLEKDKEEEPIEYYCELARLQRMIEKKTDV
ncbi:radical SAM/SPASM domain-containing protein [Candidatus Omnitrophota bacterium]